MRLLRFSSKVWKPLNLEAVKGACLRQRRRFLDFSAAAVTAVRTALRQLTHPGQ
jgi:hypothetical protein